jgi:hypothetical protein
MRSPAAIGLFHEIESLMNGMTPESRIPMARPRCPAEGSDGPDPASDARPEPTPSGGAWDMTVRLSCVSAGDAQAITADASNAVLRLGRPDACGASANDR